MSLGNFGNADEIRAAAANDQTAGRVFGNLSKSKHYESYKNATTQAEKDKAISLAMIERQGGSLVTPGNDRENRGRTPEDMLRARDSIGAIDKEIENVRNAAKTGRIDMSTAYQAMSGLNMGKAVTEFGEHVKDFGSKVKEIKPGDKESSGNRYVDLMESRLSGTSKQTMKR
jgi:hypothetical protein